MNRKIFTGISGFFILFILYHFPELLQHYFNKPLLAWYESGMLLFVIVAFLIGNRQKGRGLSQYGLFAFRKYWTNLIKGLFLGLFIAGLSNVIPILLHWSTIAINIQWYNLIFQTFIFALGTLLPSLAEDILTRGYLFAHWTFNWDKKWLIPFSATVYVLNHIFRLNRPDVMLYLFILGILLIWCLITTHSLWLTLGVHWGSNIAYQFFTNIVSVKTFNETGLENYILAGCYILGFIIVYLLFKLGFFKTSDQLISDENN